MMTQLRAVDGKQKGDAPSVYCVSNPQLSKDVKQPKVPLG